MHEIGQSSITSALPKFKRLKHSTTLSLNENPSAIVASCSSAAKYLAPDEKNEHTFEHQLIDDHSVQCHRISFK